MGGARKNRGGLYLGALAAIFGLVVLYLSGWETEVPPREALVSATGQAQAVTKGKSSVRFSLRGEARRFQHLSKSGELPLVHQALSGAGGERVTVLYDPAGSWQPAFDQHAYHTVYEIRVADRTLLSYEQASAAWQANQGIGNLLGLAFLLGGVAMAVYAKLR